MNMAGVFLVGVVSCPHPRSLPDGTGERGAAGGGKTQPLRAALCNYPGDYYS